MQRFPSRNNTVTLVLDEDVGYVEGGPGMEVLFAVSGTATCASVTDDGTHLAFVPRGAPRSLVVQRHRGGKLWERHVLSFNQQIEDANWEEEGVYHTLLVRERTGDEWRAEWDGEWRLRRIDA